MKVRATSRHAHVADRADSGGRLVSAIARPRRPPTAKRRWTRNAGRSRPRIARLQRRCFGDCKYGWVIIRIRFLPGAFGGILVTRGSKGPPAASQRDRRRSGHASFVVLPLSSLVSHMRRRPLSHAGSSELTCAHRESLANHGCGLQPADQTCEVETSESRIRLRSSDALVSTSVRAGSGHADESADVIAAFHAAQVGTIWHPAASSGPIGKLPRSGRDRPRSGRRPRDYSHRRAVPCVMSSPMALDLHTLR